MSKRSDNKVKDATIRRQKARELFMHLLFQMEVQKDYGTDIKERFLSQKDLDADQTEYIETLFSIIRENLNVIDQVLEGSSINWTVKRIGKTDLAILRLSTAEIMFYKDVPDAVSISEAVRLAKLYGTKDSGKFVNGILGKITKEKDGDREG
ncbi:MAG: transcription antitermination factor NusB [Anaerovoracaceae bacterium]|jgi:N utilization substance protein B